MLAQYASVNQEAQAAGSKPFQYYGGEFVAPVNSTQQAGISATGQYSQEAQPYYSAAASGLTGAQAATNPANNAALGLAGASSEQVNAQQIGPQQISQFENPYLGQVLGSTSALLNQNNQQQQSGALGTAIQSGAFGGDRTGIAAANLEQQQNLANANIYSGIASNAFNTALGAAQQQQGVNLSAGQANRAALGAAGQEIAGIGSTAYGEGANTASELGALGSGAQNSALSGAQAQIGAGTLEQQTSQAADTALYNQFLQAQSYPFQVAGFEAGVAEGTGALSGSTTTTQQPGGFFSDRRLKTDIKKIGKTFDGQTIYSYKMHGDARTHIGLMAQDVEKKHPESVGLAGGYKFVDYGAATEDAANRGHFYAGGVVPIRKGLAVGGMPYSIDPSLMGAGLNGGQTQLGIPTASGHSMANSAIAGAAAPTPGTSGMGGLVGLANGSGVMPGARPVTRADGGRAHYDGGGYAGPYGDLSSILATQENMYAPNQTKNRNIPSQPAQSHQLAVASGSPTPPPSGASNVQTSIGLGKDLYGLGNKGYSMYQNSELTPVQISPNAVTMPVPDAGASSPVAAPSSGLAGGAEAGASAPTAGLAGADAAAAPAATDAAASAIPVAADAAGSAAAGAAGSAAVGAAGDAAATEAAALAAEYAAADAGIAVLAAKRGGRIKRAGLDAGGVPYEAVPGGDPYSAPGGQMDIPDVQGANKLQTAGPLKKQPTGLQDALQMGNIMDLGSNIGTVFSNQGIGSKRGGRIHKQDAGEVDGSDVLPEIEVDAQRPDPEEQGPPAGLAGASANGDLSPVAIDPSDTKLAMPKRSGLSAVGDFWDRNKTDIIPALEGLAAMGTAPTKHLGVALAAGLGAGAQSYFPTQQAQANLTATNQQNQLQKLYLQSMQSAGAQGTSGSSSSRAQPAAGQSPADPNALPAYYQRKYAVPPMTQDEAAQLENAQRFAKVNPGLAQSVQTGITNRIQNQQFANTKAAQLEHDQNYTVATAPSGNFNLLKQVDPLVAGNIAKSLGFDPSSAQVPPSADNAAKIAATKKVNAIQQWTGDTYKDEGGTFRNERTTKPAIGDAAATLTPEQQSQRQIELAKPVTYGAGLPQPLRNALGPSQGGSPPSPTQAPALAAPPVRRPLARPGAAPAAAAAVAGPQAPVQPDRLPGVDINSIPKLPGPPPVTDQVSKGNAENILATNNKIKNDALDSYNEQVKSATRNAAIYTQLEKKLATADPKAFGPTSDYYKAYQGLVTALQGGDSPGGLVNQAEADKYLVMLGVGGSKQLVGAENQLRQQELLTLMQHANPNLHQPLAAVRALAAYGKANNEFDLKGGNTAIDAITSGANPRQVSGVIDARRSDYIQQALGSTPVRTGKVNGKPVTQYADGTIR